VTPVVDWLPAEAMVSRADLRLVVYAPRPRRYRRRFVALLQAGDDPCVLCGDPAATIAGAVDLLRAEYLRRVRGGWRP
jgi:hypothetical protein